jgi:hypothetical protein
VLSSRKQVIGTKTRRNAKARPRRWPGFRIYRVPDDDLLSHAKEHTIIGATPFHGPVRDGKGWDQSAMVVRESCGLCRSGLNPCDKAAFWKK